jgi:hypothetical protein
MDHVVLINRSVGSRMQWDLAAASFAHTSDDGRRDIQSTVTSYLEFDPDRDAPSRKKHKQYEQMPDEARLLSIGSSLANEGMTFLDRRPHHREWLKEKGMSPDGARLRYTEWRAEKDAAKAKRAGGGDPVGGDD